MERQITKYGDFPIDWVEHRLKDIGNIITGKTPPTEDDKNFGDDYFFVTPEDLDQGKYVIKTSRGLSIKGSAFSNPVKENSICVACIGYIGKIGIVKSKSFTNQQINSIEVYSDFDLDYIYYLVEQNAKRIESIAGITAVPQINKSTFGKFKFCLPNKTEQTQIAHFLSTVDKTIQATKNSIAKLEKLKTSLMQNLLTGKMKPDGTWRTEDEFWIDDKFGKVPKGWVVMKLRNCLKEKPKYGANASAVEFDENLPKYIRITDIDDNGYIIPENQASITLEDAKGNYLENNDFLLARTGDTVGKSFLYKSEYGLCAFAGYMIRFKIDEKILNPDLFNLIARSPIFETFKGSVKTIGAKPNINANEYSRFTFPIATNLEEQNLIYSKFKTIEEPIFLRKNKIKALNKTKKSLMQNLLTGKVRIPQEALNQ